MAEPPAKRARRTDSAAMWDRDATASPRSPGPHDSKREDRDRARYDDERGSNVRRKDDRRRSRSPRDHGRRERERSRSRDRSHRERDRDRDRYRERDSERHDRDERDRVRAHGRDRDHVVKSERRRSRSPQRNGTARAAQSPPRGPRTDHDRQDGRGSKAEVKSEPERPNVNGNAKMDVDEDDEDTRLRRVMGFSSFKSTQNKKVPGNQIYGVRKEKKTVYRQYMNRVGGFNRPLSPGR